MGYEEVWKVLADLISEIRRKGGVIPSNLMKDLRSAKTLIQIYKVDSTHIENIPQIEKYLENVEFYLFQIAEERFGEKLIETWLKKLSKSRKQANGTTKTVSKFIPGLPRDKHWIRIQISKEIPKKEIEALAKKKKLSYKVQDNNYMLIFGENEGIKSFIKILAKKLGKRKDI